jgi:hypothetical protein
VTPEPKKRPKSSYIRFQAQMPNETWQSDFTHYRLADGTDVEILTWLDDCTRFALRVTAHHLTDVVGHRDHHTPVLAERLAHLARDGHDVPRLLAAAAGRGNLPDDHATARAELADHSAHHRWRPRDRTTARQRPPAALGTAAGPDVGF